MIKQILNITFGVCFFICLERQKVGGGPYIRRYKTWN
nr:MAG TPA_asm: hypothetical protein [Caudoviricetes sp.]DAO73427.1 MAG TPA: hypothetical protein [Caudoviricetes sp.]DAY74396.1 MAG TPA: hypothetical protein [Caudoviricetes sp.]